MPTGTSAPAPDTRAYVAEPAPQKTVSTKEYDVKQPSRAANLLLVATLAAVCGLAGGLAGGAIMSAATGGSAHAAQGGMGGGRAACRAAEPRARMALQIAAAMVPRIVALRVGRRPRRTRRERFCRWLDRWQLNRRPGRCACGHECRRRHLADFPFRLAVRTLIQKGTIMTKPDIIAQDARTVPATTQNRPAPATAQPQTKAATERAAQHALPFFHPQLRRAARSRLRLCHPRL
ncbi:MAG: hypothetical protein ACLU37_10370 [Collinsella sp.]